MEYLYLIGLGDQEDWEAGRGNLYYIEDRRGETALPVFTTPEKCKKYVDTFLGSSSAHMDMLESVGASSASLLTDGRFTILPLEPHSVAEAAANIQAHYLIRDIRRGEKQQILRFSQADD